MEEKKIVGFKKEEFSIREYIKSNLGKGKISKVKIEYTPIGEKIIVSTSRPGLIIGRKGERIEELTRNLKKKFKLENPHVEIDQILKPELDAQLIADEIALALERLGPMRFKVIAYKTLQKIVNAGALGVEIRLGGKLPSSRARLWRFAQGYLKKTGDSAKVVDRAKAVAHTKPGVVGIKVAILSPDAHLHDKIEINEKLLEELKRNSAGFEEIVEEKKKKPKPVKKSSSKKTKIKKSVKKVKGEKNAVDESKRN